MSHENLPPHSLEAEQVVLGAVFQESDAFDTACEVLTESDFYSDAHRVIWNAVAELNAARRAVDAVTVAAHLEACNTLDRANGRDYLANLAFAAPTARTVRRYAEIVRERSTLRRISGAAARMQDLVSMPLGHTSAELLEEAQELLARIEDKAEPAEVQRLGACAQEFLATLEKRMDHEGIQGLATGLDDLDRMTNGLQQGDFVVIAGRPSMGKSALAMQIAQYAAMHDKRTLVFSLEMGKQQLIERMVANIGQVDGDVMRAGKMKTQHWDGISAAVGRIADMPLWVDDRAGLSVPMLRSIARKLQRSDGLDLIVVDYIGLMDGDGENRYAQVSDVSRRLKLAARELNVPLVGLAQLNRQTQQRTDKRPLMSDLRDSGAIEQDADVIMLMHREDYYDGSAPEMAGIAEVIIAKQRMGKTGTVNLHFAGEHSRFEDVVHGWRKPEKPEGKAKSKLK